MKRIEIKSLRKRIIETCKKTQLLYNYIHNTMNKYNINKNRVDNNFYKRSRYIFIMYYNCRTYQKTHDITEEHIFYAEPRAIRHFY